MDLAYTDHPAWAELCEQMAEHAEQQELAKRVRRLEEERESPRNDRGMEVSR